VPNPLADRGNSRETCSEARPTPLIDRNVRVWVRRLMSGAAGCPSIGAAEALPQPVGTKVSRLASG